MKRNIAIAAIVASCALALATYLSTRSTVVPETTFVMLDGSHKQVADLQGRVTLVNFWATSCITCVAEMPQLAATYEKFKAQGYGTIAVAMQYDQPSFVLHFAQTRKLPFDVAIDNTGTIAQSWGDVRLTPTSYLVNKRGEIVKRYVGTPNFEELHALITTLLAES